MPTDPNPLSINFFDGGPRFSDEDDDFSDPFSPFDIPEPVNEVVEVDDDDDDAVYEITPKGVWTLEDDMNDGDRPITCSSVRRKAERWYEQRNEARGKVAEYSEIIGVLMDQFELIGQKLRDERPVEAVFLVEEALKSVEMVEDEDAD